MLMTDNRLRRLPRALLLVAAVAVAFLAAALCRVPAAYAAAPTLETVPGDDLKSAYRTGQTVNLRLIYKDTDGDRVKTARFVDESTGTPYDYKTNEGGTPETGQTLDWTINGFSAGGHSGYFVVTNSVGETARYPEDQSKRYTFTVESLVTKWIVTGVGVLASLFLLPFLVYIGARSANRQGNPSSAARIGLLIGIFASLAIFIYEFVGVYDPLILIIGGVVALALLIIVLARR